MPSQRSRPSKQPRLPMPDSDDSEVDEFSVDRRANAAAGPSNRRQRGGDGEDEESEDEDEDEELGTFEDADGGNGVNTWEPDDLDGHEEDESDSDDEKDDDSEDEEMTQVELSRIKKDLAEIPLSTLLTANRKLTHKAARKAAKSSQTSASTSTTTSKARTLAEMKHRLAQMQRAKGKAVGVDLPELPPPSSDDDEEDEEREGGGLRAVRRERKEDKMKEDDREKAWQERKEKMKRDNKHAPMAMSAKRPVTRKRQVVELERVERRDPRFSALSAGNQDPNVTHQSYSFLPSLLTAEFQASRAALSDAFKAERNASNADRPARVAERERLEGEVARLRSRVERTEREVRERNALAKVKKEEKEKRAAGKGEWHLKRGDKKELLLKARFEALEEKGGKRLVNKAIEKKQKKVAAKEKKSRPFARGQEGMVGNVGAFGGGGGDKKRRRVG